MGTASSRCTCARTERFDLITAGYPTSFDNENLRTCVGSWTRNGTNIQFFALRACRVLPLPVYVIGRNLGRSVTFEATTGTALFPSAASIKVRFNLNGCVAQIPKRAACCWR